MEKFATARFTRGLAGATLLLVVITCGSPTVPTSRQEGLSTISSGTVEFQRPIGSVTVTVPDPSLSQGDTTTASAVVRSPSGRVLFRNPAWTSSNTNVVTVHPTTGVVQAVAPGTSSIIATVEAKTGQASVIVAAQSPPQVATQLAITTQPGGAVSGVLLAPQPIVQVTDANGALVPSSTASVTATIAGGAGTLAGTTTINAVGGVAAFTNLAINGAGTYTLSFSSTGLTSRTSDALAISQHGVASQLAFTSQPVTTSAGQVLVVGVTVRDALGNTATSYTGNVSVNITFGTGTSGAILSGITTVAAALGVATFSGLSIAQAGTGYSLSANATGLAGSASAPFNVTPAVASNEPADPGMGYLWSDNFDRYGSVQHMDAQGSGCGVGTPGYQILGPTNPSAFSFFGQLTDAGVNTQAEACNIAATHPEFGLTTGRSGSGIALRGNVRGGIGETGITWRSPNNPRMIGTYTGTLIMQYWFRLSVNAPVGAVGYKWWMMWYKNDPNSSRIQVSPVGGPSARWAINSGMFDGNSSGYGYQYQGPFWDHAAGKLNDGNWHRWTVTYRPNTSYNYPSAGSRNGLLQVWVDAIQIIDVSAAGVATGHCTNADLDKISTLQIDRFTFIGTLNDPPSNFTVDIDDFKVWNVP